MNQTSRNLAAVALCGTLVLAVCCARAQNAINVNLSTSTSAGNLVTINPPSGSVTYSAANIYDSGTQWNQVRYPTSGERIPTGSLNGGTVGTFPLGYAQNLVLRDSQGNTTSAQLSIAINIADIESGSSTRYEPNTGAGGSPTALMGNAWRIYRGGNSMTFTITGLATNKEYDLYVYGSTTTGGQGCQFTLAAGNVLGTHAASVQTSGGYSGNIFDAGFSPLASQGITWNVLHAISDASGTLVFNTSKNSSNGQYMNGFQLQPICDAPVINSSPTNITASVGDAVSFSVSAAGTGLTYQWRRNGVPLANGGSISGVNTDTLVVDPVALGDIALSPGYDCLVGNADGCSVLSAAGKLYLYSTTLSATPASPSNGATEVCTDTVLTLVFNQAPTLNSAGAIRIHDMANPNVPVDQIDLSQNVNGAQPRLIGGDTFRAYPVMVSGNTATLFPNHGKLMPNKTYTVVVESGTFSDPFGALYTGLTNLGSWQFTTRANGPANPTNLVVAADGSGDFCTVQGALDFLPANNNQRAFINIRNGVYQEIVNVNKKHQLTFRGETRAGTRVGYPNNNNLNAGAPWRAAFVLDGDDCVMENLTLTNSTPKGGSQAEALDLEGSRFIGYNFDLASFQDTFLVHSSGRLAYFQDALIQGDTDFIWGYGTLFFTNSEIRCRTSGGHVTQPRSPSGQNGFSFVNCRITKSFAGGTFDLGRSINTPATPAQTIFLQCLLDDAVSGYASDAGSNFWTHANSNLSATLPRTSLAYATELTASSPVVTNARNASLWLYGWVPSTIPNILSQPTNQTAASGGGATFTVVANGIPNVAYQWRRNGTNLVGETSASLVLTPVDSADAAAYSVIVSNAAGSVLSLPATLTVTEPVAPEFGSVTSLPGGECQLEFGGEAGQNFRLWATTNPGMGPVMSTWTLLTNGAFNGGETVSFIDVEAAALPQRFYLLTVP